MIVLLSGGLDSTVLATDLVDKLGSDEIESLSIDYGQRHVREISAAEDVAASLGIRHDLIDVSSLSWSLKSALTRNQPIEVPEGHYAAESMRATVVPNRNAIMLMIAVGIAASRDHESVATAVHAGDHPIYPDCRPEFVSAASSAAQLGTHGIGDVTIVAPFVHLSKTEIVSLGWDLSAPMNLSWSCYKGGEVHCGRCGTCVERIEAFQQAGVQDPTEYEDITYAPLLLGGQS